MSVILVATAGVASLTPSFPSSPLKSLKIPKFPPLFWPWQKVKVGPLSVSPMGLGTWAWGNQLLWGYEESMDVELQQVFNMAVENGVNLFDTADSYGTGKLNGQSEKLLGKFIREFKGPKQVKENIIIATKFAAYPWRLTPGQFVNACKYSLDRMQIDQIGIGQLHWSTANYAPLQERALWDGLVAMYDKGLVRAVGVSNYGPNQLVKIHEYLKARGVPLCSAQVQFSLLSMGDEQQEIKNICDSLGICLISYSPLGLGMLTGKYSPSNFPRGPRGLLFKQIIPGLEPLLNSLRKVAKKRRKTIPQVAINWCICKGTVPIPGVKTLKQAKENLGALGWYLSSDELLELEYAASQSPRKMIQNVFQTSAVSLAEYVSHLSHHFAKHRGSFSIVFSGGSLFNSLSKLVEPPYINSVEWSKWHVFWVDERVVPKDHPDSNYLLAYDNFLSKVPIPPGNVYAINDALPAEGAADDYEICIRHLLKNNIIASSGDSGFPKFDLMLLGMGPDGHVASLIPGHPLVQEKEKWVTFIKDSPKPPPERITFTFPVINSSAHVALVITGAGKAHPVRVALGDGQNSGVFPVQLVSPEGELVWFLDKEAASNL